MTQEPPTGPPPPTPGDPKNTPSRWLLPALTFVVGALLAGVAVAVTDSGARDDAEQRTASPAPAQPVQSPSPGDATVPPELPPSRGDVIVRIPGSCLEAAEGAERVAQRLDDVANAARDFNARRLQELVDDLQALQQQVRELAEECRASAQVGVAEPTPPPASPTR